MLDSIYHMISKLLCFLSFPENGEVKILSSAAVKIGPFRVYLLH